jgi:hypothetical protein
MLHNAVMKKVVSAKESWDSLRHGSAGLRPARRLEACATLSTQGCCALTKGFWEHHVLPCPHAEALRLFPVPCPLCPIFTLALCSLGA